MHEQRETSGSLVASDLTQELRVSEAGGSREKRQRGMQLRGWGEDASGTGAEAGDPRRYPGKLGDPVRRRQGPNGGTPGPGCAQRQREEATDLCGTGCPRWRRRAQRRHFATGQRPRAPRAVRSRNCSRRSAPALRLGGEGEGERDGGGGASQGGASASGRVGRQGKEGRAPVGRARKGVSGRSGGLGSGVGLSGWDSYQGNFICLAPCASQVTHVYLSSKPFRSLSTVVSDLDHAPISSSLQQPLWTVTES